MLRIAILSLLIGAAATAGVLTLMRSPVGIDPTQSPAVIWNAAKARVVTGTHEVEDGLLRLQLDASGVGVVKIPVRRLDADAYGFIHLALDEPTERPVVTLTWTDANKRGANRTYTLENHRRHSLWLATRELRGWHGELHALGLRISGQPGDVVTIGDFSVFPSSPLRKLRAIHSDLTAYAPWNTAAMNTYTGAFNASSYYPLMLTVMFLVFSLLTYAVLLWLTRGRMAFDWTVVALIFFACWISLDFFWQKRLLHQLADTHRSFAGKDLHEKLSVGPDADVYRFVTSIKPLVSRRDARIIVGSSDLYTGMRTAYYLYPLNVFWSRHTPELPHLSHLRSGDYVTLLHPTEFSFDRSTHTLTAPRRNKVRARLVFSDTTGFVVRVE